MTPQELPASTCGRLGTEVRVSCRAADRRSSPKGCTSTATTGSCRQAGGTDWHPRASTSRSPTSSSTSRSSWRTTSPSTRKRSAPPFDDELRSALVHARSADGTTLATYRRARQASDEDLQTAVGHPDRGAAPGDGLPGVVKEAFGEHTEPNDAFPIDVKWRVLPEPQVYRIDVDDHCLVLNAKYREAVVGHRSLDIDDAPLVKSLLLLLLEDHFVGTGSGAKKKREDAAWQAILLSAIKAQSARPQGE